MSKKITPFTILGDLNCWRINQYNGKKYTNTQKLYTEEEVEESGLSLYLLLSFVKNSPQLVGVSNYLNENYKIKLYDAYLFCFVSFKYLNVGDINWVKAQKIPKVEDIQTLMKYYRVGREMAERYSERMSAKDIHQIKCIYEPKLAKKKVK